ncbi:MAG TPA: EamA family transporter [Alphaproteobacteria bacterium]|nr:EamA family transporter [Alphaproteobacteria bacterium]
MFVILIALLAPALHAFSTIIDSRLSNYEFKRISTIVFFFSFTSIILLPTYLFFGKIPAFDMNMLPYILLCGFINIFYLFPYYNAMKKIDTSIINSMFALGYIFTPIFAYILLKDTLSIGQISGCAIILLFNIILNIEGKTKLKLNIAFFLMLITVSMLSMSSVVEKQALNSFNWVGFAFYSSVMSILISLSFFLFKKNRMDIIENFPNFKKSFHLFFFDELFTFIGNIAGTYALSHLAVIQIKAINSSQPFFVLLYSFLLSVIFNIKLKEKYDKKSIIKKLICFCAIVFGILLVVKAN